MIGILDRDGCYANVMTDSLLQPGECGPAASKDNAMRRNVTEDLRR